MQRSLFSILTTAVFCLSLSWAASAQTSMLNSFRQDFNTYQNRALQEKVFVHTDRASYLAGEMIWLKTYVVDGSLHQPLDLSKVVYLEILDKDNAPVQQAKVALEEGTGNGSFYLPLSMKSGNYTLRAYTSWMKNFSPHFFFEKPISVVNTLVDPQLGAEKKKAAFDVQFFPEGGELVSGIRSKVAFKAVNPFGKGLAVKGAVVQANGDTVALIDPLKFGMGHFYLEPEANNTYTAVVREPNDSSLVSFALPAIRNQGYVMQLEETGNEKLQVTIRSTYPNKAVYLLVHTRQQLKVIEAGKITDGKAVFTIDTKNLGEGISHFTLLTGDKTAVAERLYFKFPENHLTINAAADKKQYTSREKVDINLSTMLGAQAPTAANLSMAVYRLDSLDKLDEGNILSYLWLTSDLKGAIESPLYYFREKGEEVKEAMDNLLLTQGWRRFSWEDVMSPKASRFQFIPEYEGHIVKGTVTDRNTNAPVKGASYYMSVPGKLLQFYAATSDEQGLLQFVTENFYGANRVVLQSPDTETKDLSLELISPYATQLTDVVVPPFGLDESGKASLRNRHIHMQAQNNYWQEERNQLIAPKVDSLAFYGAPDKVYLLDDYVRFPTMEEVMREYVYEVRVRKQDGKFLYSVVTPDQKDYFKLSPLVLLDGTPIFDTDKIIAYNPLKVEKLAVLKENYLLGDNMIFGGVISYSTYKGELEEFPNDAKLLKLELDGLQLRRQFYSPSYEQELSASIRKPDFRELLHWAPEIKINAQGEQTISFYTSDLKGKFVVVVQGLTPAGNAGAKTINFEVTEGAL